MDAAHSDSFESSDLALCTFSLVPDFDSRLSPCFGMFPELQHTACLLLVPPETPINLAELVDAERRDVVPTHLSLVPEAIS